MMTVKERRRVRKLRRRVPMWRKRVKSPMVVAEVSFSGKGETTRRKRQLENGVIHVN